MRVLVLPALLLSVVSCASKPIALPSGQQAYEIIPAAKPNDEFIDYRVGPLDRLTLNVFQEPDLSLKEVQVDASGNLLLPLVGQLRVSGKTTTEVSAEIAERLRRFLVDPQVSVIVDSSTSQKVTVEGEVREPGVFELQGRTTLLQAMAMAKGPTNISKLSEVIVFRNIGEQRYAAVFDLKDIRRGEADDPQILGNDVVVVGRSPGKSLFRDTLTVLPAITSIFFAIERSSN